LYHCDRTLLSDDYADVTAHADLGNGIIVVPSHYVEHLYVDITDHRRLSTCMD